MERARARARSREVSIPITGKNGEAGLDEVVMLVRRMGGAVKRLTHRADGCSLTVAVPERAARRIRIRG